MTPNRYEYATKASSEPLAEPLTFHFSKRTVKNRLMNTAMAEMMSTWDNANVEARGIPTKEYIELYRRWGEGEWGLIHTGNMMIDYHQMTNAGDALIPPSAPFEGERFEAFKAVAAAAKAHGSLLIAQVSHPGRQIQARYAKESISASAVQLEPKLGMVFAPTREATEKDIEQVIEGFANAAAYLEAAGFDGINLHGAHGYLLAQFLSQRTNKRTDKYGGSLTNRMRLITEICTAIRARTSPSFILSAKINSVEFQSGGFSPEEAAELINVLQDTAGIDYVELSGGTVEELGMEWKESTRKREAFFLEFAEKIAPAVGPKDQRRTKVYITGGLRSVGAMVATLNIMDGVGLGKPAAQEPRLAKAIFAGKVEGTMKPVPPFDNDNMLGLMAAGTQLNMIGQGKAPFDLSDPEQVAQFGKDLNAHFTAVAEDGDKLTKIGYAPYTGATKPYEEV